MYLPIIIVTYSCLKLSCKRIIVICFCYGMVLANEVIKMSKIKIFMSLLLVFTLFGCSSTEIIEEEQSTMKGIVAEKGQDSILLFSLEDGSLYPINYTGSIKPDTNDIVSITCKDGQPTVFDDSINADSISIENASLLSMYMDAMDELMLRDSKLGLSDKYLSLDINSDTGLTDEEIEIMGALMKLRYGFDEVFYKNYDELVAEGYISDYFFKDGLLITITTQDSVDNNSFAFDMMKYKGGLAAYFFENCKVTKKK